MVSFGTSTLKKQTEGAGMTSGPFFAGFSPFGLPGLRVTGATRRSLLLVDDLVVSVYYVLLRSGFTLGLLTAPIRRAAGTLPSPGRLVQRGSRGGVGGI
jgi:hypothetical protein